MNPTPQTIATDIERRVHLLYNTELAYIPEDSPKFVRLHDDLDRLGRADARLRSLLLAKLFGLSGNREKVEYYLRNCASLHVHAVGIELTRLMMLLNLGYFSESIAVQKQLAAPDSGALGELLRSPPGNGAFHSMCSIIEQAHIMNLHNIATPTSDFAAAVRIMDQWGDTDEDYGHALDIAGEIMRERKLFHRDLLSTQPIEAPPDGSFGYVKLVYQVGVDVDTAIDMTCEYAERLAKSKLKIPQSMIFEFEGVE